MPISVHYAPEGQRVLLALPVPSPDLSLPLYAYSQEVYVDASCNIITGSTEEFEYGSIRTHPHPSGENDCFHKHASGSLFLQSVGSYSVRFDQNSDSSSPCDVIHITHGSEPVSRFVPGSNIPGSYDDHNPQHLMPRGVEVIDNYGSRVTVNTSASSIEKILYPGDGTKWTESHTLTSTPNWEYRGRVWAFWVQGRTLRVRTNLDGSEDVIYDKIQWHQLASYGIGPISKNKPDFSGLPALFRYLDDIHCPPDSFSSLPFDAQASAMKKAAGDSINGVAYARDLTRLKALIPSTKYTTATKLVAGNFLLMKYGIANFIRDTAHYFGLSEDLSNLDDVISAMNSEYRLHGFAADTIPHINGGSIKRETRSRIRCSRKSPVSSVFGILNEYRKVAGLELNLENVWDLVPFSFVVDWFVDIGGAFSSIDDTLDATRFSISDHIMSTKTIYDLSNDNFVKALGFEGTLVLTDYVRIRTDFLLVPPIRLQLSHEALNGHWAEAAALFVVNKS